MRALLDLVLPSACAGCRSSAGPACPGCCAALTAAPSLRPDDTPGSSDTAALLLSASTGYAGTSRRLLLAFKEHGRVELAPALADALAVAVRSAVPARSAAVAPVLLVPIPSRRSARRTRGADLTTLLARLAAARLRRTGQQAGVVGLLRHVRSVDDQAGLDAAGRAANLAGAFTARGLRPRPATVVIVDDVLTTGATVREAARALRQAGVPVRAAAAVAATSLGWREEGPAAAPARSAGNPSG